MKDKGTCERCGSKENYNFALNIGLCNPCIGKELEENASPECRDFKEKQLLNRVIDMQGAIIGWRKKLAFNSENDLIGALEKMIEQALKGHKQIPHTPTGKG